MTATRFDLVSLAKWLSVCLQTKRLSVRIPLQSIKRHIAPAWSKEILDIRTTIERRFNLKRVRDMIITYNLILVFSLKEHD